MIQWTARLPHYLDHLAPVWREVGGPFYVPEWLAEHARRRKVDAIVYDQAPPLERRHPVVVAAKIDHHAARDAGCDVVYMSHGNAQAFSGEHAGYTGGPNFDATALFLCPNQQAADLWGRRYGDVDRVVVGCPKLDRWAKVRPKPDAGEPVVALSFHWDAKKMGNPVPETWSAWSFYRNVVPKLAGEVRLIGHCHPRIRKKLEPWYLRHGIEFVRDFEDVMARADVYVNDCSSTLYEFAVVGPVVVLNIPAYRRDVDHGMRFWQFADVGLQVDTREQLSPAVHETLASDPQSARREAIVGEVYPNLGTATARAADAIRRFM